MRPLSTVRFVLQAVEQRRSRLRLRDFVILAARTAGRSAPGRGHRQAAHRPPPPGMPRMRRGSRTRVVLLDVSQSMAARTKGVQAIERARPVAAAHFAFRPGLAANLLLCRRHARMRSSTVPRPTSGRLRDELGKAAPRPRAAQRAGRP